MAGLRARRPGPGDGVPSGDGRASEDGERGQIILVAAFALAVTFVALALVLNSAIFAENLASRSGPAEGDATTFRNTAINGSAKLIRYSNRHNNSTYAAVEDNVTAGIDELNNVTARQHALNGRTTTIDLLSVDRGARIAQRDDSRTFRSNETRPDSENWTVARDLTGVRKFRMNVSQSSLSTTCPNFRNCFHVNASTPATPGPNPGAGTQNWTMSLHRSGGDVVVTVYNNSQTNQCTGSGNHVVVDVTAGTVDGRACEPLDFAENVGSPYFLYYRWGNETEGTYDLVVRNGTSPVSGVAADLHDEPSGDFPFVTPAVYAVDVEVGYQTEKLNYWTEVRVAPGEADD